MKTIVIISVFVVLAAIGFGSFYLTFNGLPYDKWKWYTTDLLRVHYGHSSFTGGEEFRQLYNANPLRFKALPFPDSGFGSIYGKDDEDVYFMSQRIVMADAKTFELTDWPFAKDKNYVYLWGAIVLRFDKVANTMAAIDPNSFAVVFQNKDSRYESYWTGYVRDATGIYFLPPPGGVLVDWIDLAFPGEIDKKYPAIRTWKDYEYVAKKAYDATHLGYGDPPGPSGKQQIVIVESQNKNDSLENAPSSGVLSR